MVSLLSLLNLEVGLSGGICEISSNAADDVGDDGCGGSEMLCAPETIWLIVFFSFSDDGDDVVVSTGTTSASSCSSSRCVSESKELRGVYRFRRLKGSLKMKCWPYAKSGLSSTNRWL